SDCEFRICALNLKVKMTRRESDSPQFRNSEFEIRNPLRIVRIIDRLNVGGPAKHVVWLTAGLDPGEAETVLVTGSVPDGEGDMSYFAEKWGVEPVHIPELSRAISPRDLVVALKLLRLLFKVRPQIVHTHKAKAGAVGRIVALLYKWATPSAL